MAVSFFSDYSHSKIRSNRMQAVCQHSPKLMSMSPRPSSRSKQSRRAEARSMLAVSSSLFLGGCAIAAIILNALSTSSTLACSRVRSEAAKPASPPFCTLTTSRIWGSAQIQELPNGQLLEAKLQPETRVGLPTNAVILKTTQGEIRFAPRNRSEGIRNNFIQQINSFLKTSESGTIEIWSGYENSFSVLSKIVGLILLGLGFMVYVSIAQLLHSSKTNPKFDKSEDSDFDKWAATSDRLHNLDAPTPKEIKLPSPFDPSDE